MTQPSSTTVLDEAVVVQKQGERQTRRSAQDDRQRKRQPRYHVILWDDDDHSYDYVIRMMTQLFGHPVERGLEIATTVDKVGRAVCLTTTLEHAELKRDQVHAFGRDVLLSRSQGPMRATIAPVDDP